MPQKRDAEMRYSTCSLGPLRMIEMTGEGGEITAGRITIHTFVRIRIIIGPGEELVSLQIEPQALVIAGPDQLYALSMDGEPIDVKLLLEMIS